MTGGTYTQQLMELLPMNADPKPAVHAFVATHDPSKSIGMPTLDDGVAAQKLAEGELVLVLWQGLADWLAADRRVWLALLSRGDLEQRIAAAEHLSKLCQRPVAFNPTASLPERDAQVAALAALLGDH